MRYPARLGRFSIDRELLEHYIDNGVLRAIMSACVVLSAFDDGVHGRICYIAYSPQFAPVERGLKIPLYDWIIEHSEPLGQITVRARL